MKKPVFVYIDGCVNITVDGVRIDHGDGLWFEDTKSFREFVKKVNIEHYEHPWKSKEILEVLKDASKNMGYYTPWRTGCVLVCQPQKMKYPI